MIHNERTTTKVLLLYPRIPDNTYWSFAYALSFIGKKASMPPLGVLTVAAMMPDTWEPRVIDENVRMVGEEDFNWCDLVFISSMMVQQERVQELVHAAKEAGKIVVAGGPYPTQFYEQINDVDHFVLGEAESGVIAHFFRDWQDGTPQKAYVKQVIRKKKAEREMDIAEYKRLQEFFGQDAVIETTESHPDLYHSPVPRYDLLDINAYGSMALQLSRGCPFSCEFCSEPALFGHAPRLKTAEQILQELQTLYELGFRGSVFFVDDNFIGNIQKVMDVLDEITNFQRERDFPFRFFTEASVNLAQSPKLMNSMQDAGFNMVFVGLETTDAATLEAAHKHQNAGRQLLDDVIEIQRHGMEVTAGFIVGMDREPDDICDQIYEFCQRAGIPSVMVGLLAPLRGSLLFERLAAENRLIDEPLGGNNTHSFQMNFVPDRNRDPSLIIDNYKKLLGRLYGADGKAYFERSQRLLEQIGDSQVFSRKVKYNEILACAKSLLRQSISPYRNAYFKLLFKTLFRRPAVFSEAVRLSIIGHHFIKITNDALEVAEIKNNIQENINQAKALLMSLRESRSSFNDQARAFVGEQQKNLDKLRKRIAKFPREYQRELRRVYQDFRDQLNSLQQSQVAD